MSKDYPWENGRTITTTTSVVFMSPSSKEKDEYKMLGEAILERGVLIPWITWNGYLVEEKNFDREREVRKWIIKNQFNRRNLTDFVRGELALAYKNILKEEAEESQKQTQFKEKNTVSQKFATPQTLFEGSLKKLIKRETKIV